MPHSLYRQVQQNVVFGHHDHSVDGSGGCADPVDGLSNPWEPRDVDEQSRVGTVAHPSHQEKEDIVVVQWK